jgi:hypothetical protein
MPSRLFLLQHVWYACCFFNSSLAPPPSRLLAHRLHCLGMGDHVRVRLSVAQLTIMPFRTACVCVWGVLNCFLPQ